MDMVTAQAPTGMLSAWLQLVNTDEQTSIVTDIASLMTTLKVRILYIVHTVAV